MSSVRMCDKCGGIFSEREDGWETYTATQMTRDEATGRRTPVQVNLDACPTCALGSAETPVPIPTVRGDDPEFFTRKALEGKETNGGGTDDH